MGELILIMLCVLLMCLTVKFAKLYCKGIDELLTDISKAVRGEYKSKYKKDRSDKNE